LLLGRETEADKALLAKIFKAADKNGDGFLDTDEISEFIQQIPKSQDETEVALEDM